VTKRIVHVLLTGGAARDLEDIYEYVSRHDGPVNAEKLLDKIENILNSLTQSPERGVYPKELIELGIRQYRELFFKPYRIIYKAIGDSIYILLIVDGRRDMQAVLQRRLLDS
jgi:toxin ParE1/3/4